MKDARGEVLRGGFASRLGKRRGGRGEIERRRNRAGGPGVHTRGDFSGVGRAEFRGRRSQQRGVRNRQIDPCGARRRSFSGEVRSRGPNLRHEPSGFLGWSEAAALENAEGAAIADPFDFGRQSARAGARR